VVMMRWMSTKHRPAPGGQVFGRSQMSRKAASVSIGCKISGTRHCRMVDTSMLIRSETQGV
jgi:hypothetical protein